MAEAEAQFRKYLSEKGLRVTEERLAILQEVMSLHKHFEADDVHAGLRRSEQRISQATVFRTLVLLVDSGIVRKNPCERIPGRYEHVFGHEHHDHLVCLRCGRIIEFQNGPIEKWQEKVAKQHDFRMAGHYLVIRGYCKECR
jgi:Fur family ferric uptake transcriptional regulator